GQRQAGGRQTPPQARNAAQQQILDLLQSTPQCALGGEEGAAKIDQVQIVPNAITNSLLVSSPPDVLEIIERIINELEALTGHQVTVIRSYELLNARLDDVLPLLQDVFGAAAGGRGGEAGRGASPANLGPVSITGDPRNNTIIYSAMSKDVPLIEEQIKALDIEGLISEADLYVCQFGDAASIAQTVGQIFQIGQGGRGGREGAPAGLGGDLRISAEPMTNSIMLYGPAEK